MIDIEVEKFATQFITKYSLPIDINNPYKLDLTLYSTSLLDFILDYKFFPSRINILETELLEASSYLGLTLHKLMFQADPSIQVDLTLSELPTKEVKFTIKGLPTGLKEPSLVKLTSLLKEIYINKKLKVHTLKDSLLHPALSNRPMFPIALGIALGFSSYYEGPIKDYTDTELSLHFYNIFNILCEEVNDSLKVINPIISSLELREICNPGLIGPPFGFEEAHLGKRAISTIVKVITTLDLATEQREQLYRALLKMPDIHISALGFIFVASGTEQLKSLNELGEFSMHYPLLASSFRGMYQYLRKQNGSKGWEDYLKEKNLTKAIEEFDIEISCGLLPFIYALNFEDIFYKKHIAFYDFLAHGKISQAINLGKKFKPNTYSPSFILSFSILNLLSGKNNEALQIIENLNKFTLQGYLVEEITNCIEYLANSLSNQHDRLKEHVFKPISSANLWNLNYIYLKTYLEDQAKMGLTPSSEIFPETEEEGLSLSSNFYLQVLFGQSIKATKSKFSASPYPYWTNLIKFKQDLNSSYSSG